MACVVLVILSSCKKDKDENPSPNTPSSPPPLEHPLLKVGNKWVYETVYVDNFGGEKLDGLDSIYVEKDTMMNGKKWYKSVVQGRDFDRERSYISFYRDSAGILINGNGERVATQFEKPRVFGFYAYIHDGDTMFTQKKILKPGDTTVLVPAGIFKVRNLVTAYKLYPYRPQYPFVYKNSYEWYSKELGVIIYSTRFYHWPASMGLKDHLQKRLVRYEIK